MKTEHVTPKTQWVTFEIADLSYNPLRSKNKDVLDLAGMILPEGPVQVLFPTAFDNEIVGEVTVYKNIKANKLFATGLVRTDRLELFPFIGYTAIEKRRESHSLTKYVTKSKLLTVLLDEKGDGITPSISEQLKAAQKAELAKNNNGWTIFSETSKPNDADDVLVLTKSESLHHGVWRELGLMAKIITHWRLYDETFKPLY